MTISKASSPMNFRSSGTWIRDGSFTPLPTSRRPNSIFDASRSPMAWRTVLESAATAADNAQLDGIAWRGSGRFGPENGRRSNEAAKRGGGGSLEEVATSGRCWLVQLHGK